MTAPRPGPQSPQCRSRVLGSIDEVSPQEWNALLSEDASSSATNFWRPSSTRLVSARRAAGRRVISCSGTCPVDCVPRCLCTASSIRGASSCSTLPGLRLTHAAACSTTPSSSPRCPFTPASGPRLLAAAAPDQDVWQRELARSAVEWAGMSALPRSTCSLSTRRRPTNWSARISSCAVIASSTGTTTAIAASRTFLRASLHRNARKSVASAAASPTLESNFALCVAAKSTSLYGRHSMAFTPTRFCVTAIRRT